MLWLERAGRSPSGSRSREDTVTFQRLAALALIFLGASLAWAILGSSIVARAGQFNGRLEQEVHMLWGEPHRQVAPQAFIERPGTETEVVETKDADGRVTRSQVQKAVLRPVAVGIESTRANVELTLEYRKRGLLWYSTYAVSFSGTYRFRNPDAEARQLRVTFPLPAKDALFDDVVFAVDGRSAVPAVDVSKAMQASATVAPGAMATVDVRYKSRGLGTWTYAFADTGVAQVRDFNLALRTNFSEIDFPAGSISPTAKTEAAGGWTLNWAFTNLISGQTVGMQLPERLNPGPLAARITFFAPVSLLFFLAVMVMVGVTSGPSLHPMHYWFISAAFFAFHLLLAYLVDHVSIHLAFAASAVVSVALVVSYLRLVTGMRHALLQAGVTQVVFLVLFSYAFFFEGFTGLTITIGAIVTLFVMMQLTARVSWDDVFAGGERRPRTAREDGHATSH
jgi:inner membrane protein involved in colicin E2 resistance